MKRRKYLLLVALCVLALVALFFFLKKGDQSVNDFGGNGTPVVLGNIESLVTASGTLEPRNYVDVGAQVSGLIKKLHVDIGDTVKQGDLIAEIDPDVYESQVRGDEARLKTFNAQLAEQQALLTQSKQKLARNKKLVDVKAISVESYEDARTAVVVAKAKLSSLKAQIEEARSTLEGDKTNLSYTKIYSPADGTVVDQLVKEGQTINAVQQAPVIVQVANLDTMTVRAQVAEADVMKLEENMSVYFTTLGSQERRWYGNIRQILPTPETINDVVLYNVLVDVENADNQLMTGMTTQMFFVLSSLKNVLVIAKSALIRRLPKQDTKEGEAYLVSVFDGDDKILPKTVIVSTTDRTKAAISSGLKVGDRVSGKMPARLPEGGFPAGGKMGPPPGMGGL